jgi:hypothetical protein
VTLEHTLNKKMPAWIPPDLGNTDMRASWIQ